MSAAGWVTLAAFAGPLLLAGALTLRWLRPVALALAPLAALPALILALGLLGPATLDWTWALLGARLGPVEDGPTQRFLLFTAGLWWAAGLFARASQKNDPRRARFFGFFLLTLAGNVGLVLAQDVASFYGFFSLMTFSAYGLIIHEQSAEARRAGRIYLVMALVGEVLLLAAFVIIVGEDLNLELFRAPLAVAGDPHPALLSALLLVGFGIKAGAFLLHLWLPLAHPVAPTPASAVLSGAMIKAGVLGWLRFLPLGVVPLPEVGLTCVVLGLTGAYFGVVAGLSQREPKTVLAYSSVSQMGLITAALGVGLARPSAAPAVIAAIVLFAVHHALAKGALFLGTGVIKVAGPGWPTRVVMLGLLAPALVLAGAPFTSGAVAKHALGDLMSPGALSWVFSFTAVGTALLMIHFLRCAVSSRHEGHALAVGLWLPWALVVGASLGLPLLLGAEGGWPSTWPLLGALALAGAGWLLSRRGVRLRVALPPGDLVVLLERAWALAPSMRTASQTTRSGPALPGRLWSGLLRASERGEAGLAHFGTIGLLFLLLVLVVLAAQGR